MTDWAALYDALGFHGTEQPADPSPETTALIERIDTELGADGE